MAKTLEEKRRQHAEYMRKWNLANPGKSAGYQRRKYLKDPDAALAARRQHRMDNIEPERARDRLSWAKNKEKKSAQAKARHATPKGRHPARVRNALKAGYAPPPHELDCPPRPEACQCCGKTSPYALQLDHDHITGAFRGWICKSCNMGLGKLGDDSAGIARAAAYLRGPVPGVAAGLLGFGA